MATDPSQFFLCNVVDTCAIWNVLSSRRLFGIACTAGCVFCCTAYVNYECLKKPRNRPSESDRKLQDRLISAQRQGQFAVYHLEIDDLLEVDVLEQRKRLGHGELSSVVFAKRTNQAFLTDDQKARSLAHTALPSDRVQTTPHLLGWLLFTSRLTDGDCEHVKTEHTSLNRPLEPFFEKMYRLALEYRFRSRA